MVGVTISREGIITSSYLSMNKWMITSEAFKTTLTVCRVDTFGGAAESTVRIQGAGYSEEIRAKYGWRLPSHFEGSEETWRGEDHH